LFSQTLIRFCFNQKQILDQWTISLFVRLWLESFYLLFGSISLPNIVPILFHHFSNRSKISDRRKNRDESFLNRQQKTISKGQLNLKFESDEQEEGQHEDEDQK
jgi:hypothetical protein